LAPAIFGNCEAWNPPTGLEFDADFAGCWSILVILRQSLPRLGCGAAPSAQCADLWLHWELRNVIGAK